MDDMSPIGMSVGVGIGSTMMRNSLPPGLASGLRARSGNGVGSGASTGASGVGKPSSSDVAKARDGADVDDHEKRRLAQACSEFEAIFIEMMLKSARASIPKGGLFSSEEQELVEGMLDAQLAQEIAKGGGIGLAKFMERNMTGDAKVVNRGGSGQL